ncbi:hypothetical protein KSP39_PZI015221 [Platanthera zijinensis]|uniref:Uncharacterized protein n=1 Tax=Platanthera zijinensis TaxID=2320716 RepID=A0AAP0B9P5_9ASPA
MAGRGHGRPGHGQPLPWPTGAMAAPAMAAQAMADWGHGRRGHGRPGLCRPGHGQPRPWPAAAMAGRDLGRSGRGRPPSPAAAAVMTARRHEGASPPSDLEEVPPCRPIKVLSELEANSASPYRTSMAEKEKEKSGGERWKMAIVNLSEMGANLESLQTILAKKAVFVDSDTFSKASLISEQTRNIKAAYNADRFAACANSPCLAGSSSHAAFRSASFHSAAFDHIVVSVVGHYSASHFGYIVVASSRRIVVPALGQRVENLERELDAAISAAARARSERRQAESAQQAAELRAQDVTRELENTTSMYIHISYFMLHFVNVIHKRRGRIEILGGIILSLRQNKNMHKETVMTVNVPE